MYTTVQVLRNIIYAAAARGGNLKRLSSAAGLQISELQNAEHRLEGVMPVVNLWEEVITSTNDDCFGLHFGERYNPSMLGLLGFLLQSCRTLGEVYTHLEKYQEVVSGWISYRLEKKKGRVEVIYTVNPLWQLSSPHTARHALENAMSAALTSHAILTQTSTSPLYAEIAYQKTASLQEYERVFGCTVTFGKSQNKFVFDSSFAERPLVNQDQSLYISLSGLLKEKLSAISATDTFVKRLQQVIIRDFQGQAPRLNIISAHLNMSERNFQRKLQAENMSYRAIMENFKKELAFTLLTDPSVNLSAVSTVLGYADPTAFYRAFKKWKKVIE